MRFDSSGNIHQRGFSLLELLGALAIIAILAAVVLRGLNRAENSANASGMRQQALSLVTALKEAYQLGSNPSGRYTGLSAANLIASRLAPEEMVNGTGLQHQNGGPVTLTAVTLNGTANAGAQVLFSAVGGSSCTTVANAIRGQVRSLTVGTTVVLNDTTAFDPSVLNTACNATSVNITFVLS